MEVLTKANERCEWLRFIYIWYLIGATLSTVSISIVSVIVRWVNDEALDVAYFYHPLTVM